MFSWPEAAFVEALETDKPEMVVLFNVTPPNISLVVLTAFKVPPLAYEEAKALPPNLSPTFKLRVL